ncbi:hypothetical protein BEN48_10855 [Hymenobacter glacialis]|uniref:Uncharacterized protein n=1 Tax=Hymenobacter glacialis TaxID=1908236 RepID=A0A1G1TAB3_9BACT|nr:hypothetical protein BEN48_10855 [Hymenobacter glacialis]
MHLQLYIETRRPIIAQFAITDVLGQTTAPAASLLPWFVRRGGPTYKFGLCLKGKVLAQFDRGLPGKIWQASTAGTTFIAVLLCCYP